MFVNETLQTWDLFQKGHLFYAWDQNEQNSDRHQLAEMIALLGPPLQLDAIPVQMLILETSFPKPHLKRS